MDPTFTEQRLISGVAKRRDYLGIDIDVVHRITDTTVAALSGGTALTRAELSELWAREGITIPDGARYHLIWWLGQTGVIVQGPVDAPATDGRAPEPRFVLTSEWIPAARTLNGDEALAELATRFTRGRGVVSEADLCWWAGLGKRAVRRGLAVAQSEGRIAELTVDGEPMFADPEILGSPGTNHESAPLMLPAFDEHLLGFTDRSLQLDRQFFSHVVPGRNGVFRPTVVQNGRVAGTWAVKRLTTRTVFEVTAFEGARLSEQDLEEAAASWVRFHGAKPPELRLR